MSNQSRIVRRFQAGAIADPYEGLTKFKAWVENVSRYKEVLEQQMPLLKKFVAAGGYHDTPETAAMKRELESGSFARADVSYQVRFGAWFKYGQRAGAQELFWAILQQYDLPPRLRTSIEAASRFWAKKRVNGVRTKSIVEACEVWLKVLSNLDGMVAAAEQALSRGKLHSSENSKTKVRCGPFDLVNTGGFSDKEMSNVAEAVHKAVSAMEKIGLLKVCYGDILVSKTISRGRVLAFYVVASDEMFVRANVKDDIDSVQVICHELVHRYQHKFLSTADESVVHRIYDGMRYKLSVPYDKYPQVGKTVKYKGVEYKVNRNDPNKQSVIIEDPVGVKWSVPAQVYLTKYEGEALSESEGFITMYARKSPWENFAEMVSYYAIGKLPRNQIDLILPILH